MNAWDRRDKEGARAYEAFRVYCEMGAARSLASVAKKLSKSETLIARWSGQHDWVARVIAYDEAQAAYADQLILDAREALLTRDLEDSQRLLDAFDALFKKLRATDVDGWVKLIRLRREITAMRRLALGLPETVKEDRLTGKDGSDLVFEFAIAQRADDTADDGDANEGDDEAAD